MRAGNFIGSFIVALALMLVCVNVRAEYKYDYSHGLQALEDHDYAKAQKLIAQALDDHPEPAVRIRLYGQVWQPYLPQYYLGLIAFTQGDCASAMRQWNAPASRDVVAQVPKIAADQARDSGICRNKIATATPKAANDNDGQPKPTVATSSKSAQVHIGPNSKIGKNVAISNKPVEPSKPQARKDAPPQLLIDAFRDYLNGRYAEVAHIDPQNLAEPRSRWHAWLVRAAAKFTLARISGDAHMLDGARSDVQAAHAQDASATPDTQMFSPAFRAFYRASK